MSSNVISFAWWRNIAVRRAVYQSLGLPFETLAQAQRANLIFRAASLVEDDGPRTSSSLATLCFEISAHVDGFLIQAWSSPYLPGERILVAWDLEEGRPLRAQRCTVEADAVDDASATLVVGAIVRLPRLPADPGAAA